MKCSHVYRVLVGEVLESRAKVAVLVDNLDKVWNPNGDLALLSDLLFGLLGVSRRVIGSLRAIRGAHDVAAGTDAEFFRLLDVLRVGVRDETPCSTGYERCGNRGRTNFQGFCGHLSAALERRAEFRVLTELSFTRVNAEWFSFPRCDFTSLPPFETTWKSCVLARSGNRKTTKVRANLIRFHM